MIMKSEATTHYIAVDEDLSTGTIYGFGESEETALEDARSGAGPDATVWEDGEWVLVEYRIIPATGRLCKAVYEIGGGPGDVDWSFKNGVADLAT